MGEYAKYRGESIKIGTCESMYYLRADQVSQLDGVEGSSVARYFDDETLAVVRFRFPFPDEDTNLPGQFEDYNRGVRIPGWTLPAEFDDHGSVQFTASPGYLLSLPCPEQYGRNGDGWGTDVPIGDTGATLHVHRNGFNGGPKLVAQGYRDDQLRSVVQCGACGSMWNLPPEMAEEVAVCFRSEADRQEFRSDLNGWGPANGEKYAAELHAIACRILEGYYGKCEAVQA